MVKRFWDHVDVKMAEGCRICGDSEVDRAHIVPRRYDKKIDEAKDLPEHTKAYLSASGVDTRTVLYVHPDGIVPLCRKHHEDYDHNKMDLLPHLSKAEQGHAAATVGLIGALNRTTRGDVNETVLDSLEMVYMRVDQMVKKLRAQRVKVPLWVAVTMERALKVGRGTLVAAGRLDEDGSN